MFIFNQFLTKTLSKTYNNSIEDLNDFKVFSLSSVSKANNDWDYCNVMYFKFYFNDLELITSHSFNDSVNLPSARDIFNSEIDKYNQACINPKMSHFTYTQAYKRHFLNTLGSDRLSIEDCVVNLKRFVEKEGSVKDKLVFLKNCPDIYEFLTSKD